MAAPRPPLGGLSPRTFLRDYWQKRPLLVRQAVPGFAGVLDRQALFNLASGDEAEARLVESAGGWRVTEGPIARRVFRRLPDTGWTLLVNGVNLHSPAADALLRRFAFASWARLDDIMVSDAADGGGVGPHVDSYDVFLLQGPGRRRWRLMPPGSRPFDRVPGAPLKLIAGFRPTEEMTLEPGDMLYLPPGWGHEGTALGACQTYSIGFRAPDGVELSTTFLDFLHERGFAETRFADPGRVPAAHPARIDRGMIDHAAQALGKIRWTRADVGDFLGRSLSEPKQHVVFARPLRLPGRATFIRRLAAGRVSLDPRTRMLALGARLYVNGAAIATERGGRAALLELADRREIAGSRVARGAAAALIFEWYRQGYLAVGKSGLARAAGARKDEEETG